MSMQNELKQLIKESISPLFKAKGFKKRGNNFAKAFSDFAFVVNIQNSKWNTKEEVESPSILAYLLISCSERFMK